MTSVQRQRTGSFGVHLRIYDICFMSVRAIDWDELFIENPEVSLFVIPTYCSGGFILKSLRIAVAAASCLLASASWSADYQFDVIYSGNGVAALAAGSQDPRTSTLLSGDSFTWTINAVSNYQWSVLSGGDVFPMMAFGMSESADRTGSFFFRLFNDGVEVFSKDESNSLQSLVHMGTNAITLPTGLVFDSWKLHYSLISAIEVTSVEDPANPGSFIEVRGASTTSSPNTLLPIFGIRDNTQTANASTTIFAPVPEPETYAMLLAGLGIIGAVARRRKLQQG